MSTPTDDVLPLQGVLVVALEQAVAAPYCSSRLADAGARVIKIERPEGDFARGYDTAVLGESSYFVWINRGKESISLDLKKPTDLSVLDSLISKADVFIQNLAPGATHRMGLGSESLRARFPTLITCDISGYGETGPGASMKAYDLLVQAESGLVAVSGPAGEDLKSLGRIGVSVCDINAGMNALIGIQQALLMRHRSGRGSGIKVSLFDSAAELMSVPYLQARYGGKAPARVGLKHPSIAPYGAFTCKDNRTLLIAIQNEREWHALCTEVFDDSELKNDPRASTNHARTQHRAFVDGRIASLFEQYESAELVAKLRRAQIAYGNVNQVDDLIKHPQLRTKPMPVGEQWIEVPALPWRVPWEAQRYRKAPRIGEHSDLIRRDVASEQGQ
ncbi:MAG: hypothetical protein RL539_1081 [Pseudomonadota bacterium]